MKLRCAVRRIDGRVIPLEGPHYVNLEYYGPSYEHGFLTPDFRFLDRRAALSYAILHDLVNDVWLPRLTNTVELCSEYLR